MRPVREQLEHDRVIRLLQAKWRRRYQVGINPGTEQMAAVGPSTAPLYPDVVLWSPERGRRVEGVVEVETAESVNNMEALAEWGPYSRLRAAFYLYIPNGSADAARRLVAENAIAVTEIWTYYLVGDQMRFTMVFRASAPPVRPVSRRQVAKRPRAASPRRKPAAGRARGAKAAKPARKRPRPAKKATRKPGRLQKRK
jgi:hypothetical protein